MCGRFSFKATKDKIKHQFDIEITEQEETRFSYNIAPTHNAYVISDDNTHKLNYLLWGLIPHWVKDESIGPKLINARSEGISSKPSFRMSIRHKRCIVLADSFYEWRKEGKNKIPYRILPKDESLLAMAGIWDEWSQGGKVIKTFSIITTPPNKEMSTLHNRMPVLINSKEEQQKWLSHETSFNDIMKMLKTPEDNLLHYYRISEHLNAPKNNYPELHEEVPEPPTLF